VVRPAPKIVPRSEPTDDGLVVKGLKGTLPPAAIQAGIAPVEADLTACYKSNLKGSRFLSGNVVLGFRIKRDGTVRTVDLAESNLGSWRVEKCLLDVGRGLRFVEPEGGEATFTVPLEFQGARGEVLSWEAERLGKRLPTLDKKIEKTCRGVGRKNRAQVTLYLGRRGKVRSVGFAGAAVPDDWKDCAEAVISESELIDPRGQLVKISFWVPSG
jgi:hypothetical protein